MIKSIRRMKIFFTNFNRKIVLAVLVGQQERFAQICTRGNISISWLFFVRLCSIVRYKMRGRRTGFWQTSSFRILACSVFFLDKRNSFLISFAKINNEKVYLSSYVQLFLRVISKTRNKNLFPICFVRFYSTIYSMWNNFYVPIKMIVTKKNLKVVSKPWDVSKNALKIEVKSRPMSKRNKHYG